MDAATLLGAIGFFLWGVIFELLFWTRPGDRWRGLLFRAALWTAGFLILRLTLWR